MRSLIAAFVAGELVRRGSGGTILGDDELRDLVARRRQLVDALQAEHCRLASARSGAVEDSLVAVISALRTSLDAIQDELLEKIKAKPSWIGSFTCCKACMVSDLSPPWS